MKAVVLAGGFGSRLRPLTFTKPKPMIPLVNEPVIEHIVDYLVSYGINDVVVTTNFLREMIEKQFREREDVHISYPNEPYPLGTAGSVKNAGLEREEEPFVVIQGDNITDLDLRKLIAFHSEHTGLATIALTPVEDPWNFGIAQLDENSCITRFKEKPSKGHCFSNLANTGIYVIEPRLLDFVPEGAYFDFAKDLFRMLQQKERGRMFGYQFDADNFWVDVGQPEGYMKATEWMLKRTNREVAIGSGAEVESSEIRGPAVIGANVLIEENCTVGPHAVLFEDVDIGTNSRLDHCLIGERTMLGEKVSVRDAIIGANCELGNASEVLNGTIWPCVTIPQNSVVDSVIKRFVRFNGNGANGNGAGAGTGEGKRKKGNGWLSRTLSEEEAFHFAMHNGKKVVSTGVVAYSLKEFLAIVKKIDQKVIDFHLNHDAPQISGFPAISRRNDFSAWIQDVFNAEELADLVDELYPGELRTTLACIIQGGMLS